MESLHVQDRSSIDLTIRNQIERTLKTHLHSTILKLDVNKIYLCIMKFFNLVTHLVLIVVKS